MFKKLALFTTVVAVSSCSQFGKKAAQNTEPVQAQVKNLGELELNLDVTKKILPNGMKVLIAENHKLPIYSIYTFFDVGGRYESKGTTGATHFLEHMMFKKTKNYETGHFSAYIEQNGGSSNAYTTFDNTVYYESLPVHTLDKMIGLEAERLSNLLLDEKEFESERQVVLEERKMRYENSPRGQLYLTMMKAMFEGTPYGGSVIGDAQDVKNLSREKMMDFYNKFYKPNNATMVIVGDVDTDKVIDIINEKFKDVKYDKNLDALKKSLDGKAKYVSKSKLPKRIKINGQSTTPLFSLSFPAPKVGEKDSYALDFLSNILSTGDSSYLVKRYIASRKPMLSKIYAANYSLMHSGLFFIQGQLLEKVSLNTFRKNLFESLKKSCDRAVTRRNVEKTKNQILIDYYSSIGTNKGLASFLGSSEFSYGDYRNYRNELAVYNSMTVEQVKDVCKRYLNPKKSAFISVWNKHAKR
jgi:zinc protease